MKRIYQYLMLTGISGLLCLFLAVPANAQRGGGHSGGGGGSRSGGGSHFSSGGSRGGGSSFSSSRGGSAVHSSNSFSAPRQSVSRSNQSFSNRAGVANSRSFSRGSSVSRSNSLSFRRGGATAYRGGISSGRGGFSRGGRYYPGGYGGRGSGYRYSPWYNRGGYFYNRGLYRSAYYPRLGFSLGILPFGYYPFYWGADQFYFSSGYFYQYNNDQYTVVEPPIGAAINTLPDNAQAITINGQQYYELNGVYYTPITKDDGTLTYQVAGKDGQLDTDQNGDPNDNGGNVGNNNSNAPAVAMPEIGDLFYNLPPDTRRIKINSVLYYVSPDDFYYQETQDQHGTKAYKVVGTPDDTPGN